jgi:hypothetical protein
MPSDDHHWRNILISLINPASEFLPGIEVLRTRLGFFQGMFGVGVFPILIGVRLLAESPSQPIFASQAQMGHGATGLPWNLVYLFG